MTDDHTIPDDAPPPLLRVARLPFYLFFVLALYITASEIFADPFPFPVREIAGGLMIGLLLVNHAWRWLVWFRSSGARSSIVWRALWTVAIALVCYGIFTIVYFNPLPGLLGMILIFMAFPVILGASAWGVSTCRDEVYRASVFEGYTWGALVGLVLAVSGIFVVRVSPGVSDWLQAWALHVTNGLTPAAVGFALGAVFSVLVISMSLTASWAIWWLRKR